MQVVKKYGIDIEGNYLKLNISHTSEKLISEYIESCNQEVIPKMFFQKLTFTLHLINFRKKIGKIGMGKNIRELFPSDFREINETLTNLGLLEISKSYSVALKIPKAYKILIEKPTDYTSISIEKFSEFIEYLEDCEKRYAEKFNYLKGIRFRNPLEVDRLIADKELEYIMEFEGDIDKYKKYSALLNTNVSNLRKGQYFLFKKRNAEQRLYSTISILPKEFRKILVDKRGIKLVEIDVKSSQMRIFSRTISEYILSNIEDDKFELEKLAKSISISVSKFIENLKIELDQFEELTKSDLYHELSINLKITRDDVKKSIIIYFNDYRESQSNIKELNLTEHNFQTSKLIKNYFQSKFNHLYQFIEYLHQKERINRLLNKSKYSKFSISQNLSRYESSLILESARIFRKLYKKVAIATIHDSSLIPSDYIQQYLKILNSIYLKKNITLKIKIDEEDVEIDQSTSDNLNSLTFEQDQFQSNSINTQNPIKSISYNNQNSNKNNNQIYISPTVFSTTLSVQKNDESDCKLSEKSYASGDSAALKVPSFETIGHFARSKARVRLAKINILGDGRFCISVKGKKHRSLSGETRESFLERLSKNGVDISLVKY